MFFEGTFNGFGLESPVTVDEGGTFVVVPASGFADTMAGVGTKANYAGTGVSVLVYPTQQLQGENPYVTAQMGYVEANGTGPAPPGASAPVLVHDPRLPLCYATLAGGPTGRP